MVDRKLNRIRKQCTMKMRNLINKLKTYKEPKRTK